MTLINQELFTPIFIIIAICILIFGIVGIQLLDKLFINSNNLNAIRMFGIAIVVNIIILIFILMSFSKIKFAIGSQGPQGNKGYRGAIGPSGGIDLCTNKYQTAEEKKNFQRIYNYLDTKPPLLN